LAATVADAALAYAAIAGPDSLDPMSSHQPAPTLEGWDNVDLAGLTLGVYWPWFRHATDDVVSVCEAMLGTLERMGARVREVTIPGLEAARVAHQVTIAAEMTQALDSTYAAHHREHSLEVRLTLALARTFTARDYIKAQQVRTHLIANLTRVLEDVDAVISPTNALVAPPIPVDTLPDGESDLSTLVEIMRFVTPPNLTGHPAITFPAGYDGAGMPVGMQAIGRAWQEPTLLRLARAAEQAVERLAPAVHYPILPDALP
jgi:Asp-tRNA(Asn)/Glu-tRNA(Gln) amidotransferase A subunit family amidase